MNCPQCQERLDERLDQLRPQFQPGASSQPDARAQALLALEETAHECSECEKELRAHFHMRLALMMPDETPLNVPTELRVNVRRALERESETRPRPSAWNPMRGFAWTGGAVLSAVGLFIIARPFLIQSAQKPLPVGENALPPADIVQNSNNTAGSGASGVKPRTALPSPKSTSTGGTAGKGAPKTPAPLMARPGAGGPAALVPPSVPPVRGTAPVPPPVSAAPPPPALTPPLKRAKRPPTSTSESPRLSAPRPPSGAFGNRRSSTGSSAPSLPGFGSSGKNRPRSSVPTEPRLDASLLAPSGEALGLAVRVVPPAAAAAGQETARSMKPPLVGRAAPSAPTASAPEEAVADAPTQKPTPPQPSATVRSRPFRPSPKAQGVTPDDMANLELGSSIIANAQNTAAAGTLTVSVKQAVTNARIAGQVKGRKGDDVLLWSGNAAAGKSISVPLAPLGAKKGDEIEVFFQQQVSLGQTKTLATTSVIAP